MKQIEFFITPEGKIMVQEQSSGLYEYNADCKELVQYVKGIIEFQFPDAFEALEKLYERSKPNKAYFDYLVTHRFIRCNFGKFDGLSYDIDDGIMHIEEVQCPIVCECPYRGIICKPKVLGLTDRQKEIARMSASGHTHEEIAAKLGISCSCIKNVLYRIKNRFRLKSSKEIVKLLVTTI